MASSRVMTVIWADVIAMAMREKVRLKGHFGDRTEKACRLGLMEEKNKKRGIPIFMVLNV